MWAPEVSDIKVEYCRQPADDGYGSPPTKGWFEPGRQESETGSPSIAPAGHAKVGFRECAAEPGSPSSLGLAPSHLIGLDTCFDPERTA